MCCPRSWQAGACGALAPCSRAPGTRHAQGHRARTISSAVAGHITLQLNVVLVRQVQQVLALLGHDLCRLAAGLDKIDPDPRSRAASASAPPCTVLPAVR